MTDFKELTDEEIKGFLFDLSDEYVRITDVTKIERYETYIDCDVIAEVTDMENREVVWGIEGGLFTVKREVTLFKDAIDWPFRVNETDKWVRWIRFLNSKNMIADDALLKVEHEDLVNAYALITFAEQLAASILCDPEANVKTLAEIVARGCKDFAENNIIADLCGPTPQITPLKARIKAVYNSTKDNS